MSRSTKRSGSTKDSAQADTAPEVDLATLDTLSIADLRSLWKRIGGKGEPVHRRVLIREIAYLVQTRRTGGMDRSTERLLAAAVRDAFKDPTPSTPTVKTRGRRDADPLPTKRKDSVPTPRHARTEVALPDGARLVRTWRGRTYEVIAAEGGKAFIYNGTTYRSLSKVAEAITGTVWSGPLFFGLARQTRSKERGR